MFPLHRTTGGPAWSSLAPAVAWIFPEPGRLPGSSSTWSRSGSWTPPAWVLVGGLRRVRACGGSLDLICTQQRVLKIVKITGLAEVFGIYATVGQALAAV